MAKDPKTAAARGKDAGKAKATKAGKARAKPKRGERWKQILAAYRITRQRDPRLPLWMLLAFFGVFGVILLLLTVLGGPIFINIPIALLGGMVGLMAVFGRRAQKAAFREAEGQPGAAGWALQNMRGNWRVTQGVQVTAQLDAVHRVLGRPGVILVGEGSAHRTRSLMAQEKKRVARVAGDTPIYDVQLGPEEGQVPLRKLSAHLTKLPRNLTPAQVNALETRLQALGGTKTPQVPKGPIPRGARMPGLERALRRR
jgi:Domain of unknown function (DUF4191)